MPVSVKRVQLFSRGGAFARMGQDCGGRMFCDWNGYALIPAGSSLAAASIISPRQERGTNMTELIIPAGAKIFYLGIQALGDLTLGAAAGRLKLADSVAQAAAGAFVATGAATGGTLAKMATPATLSNNEADMPVIAADTTFKIFADTGLNAASTVTAAGTERVKVLVAARFYLPAPFPTEGEVGEGAPED